MIEVLSAEEYESFDNGLWGSEEDFQTEKELAEERGEEFNPDDRFIPDEYEYDRDALKAILIKYETDNPGYHTLWVAPDGTWFVGTLEAYFYCSESKEYERLLFNAFEAGRQLAEHAQGNVEDDFKQWRKA